MVKTVFLGDLYWSFTEISRTISIPEQLVPLPVYPSLHVHVKLPAVFVQFASLWQSSMSEEHSLISEHTNKYPFIYTYFILLLYYMSHGSKIEWMIPLPVQSPMVPLPLNPDLHEQVKFPTWFVQSAFTSQLWNPSVHSSISVNVSFVKIKMLPLKYHRFKAAK